MVVHLDIKFQTQGGRKTQEDAFVFGESDSLVFVAVLDGHFVGDNDELSKQITNKFPKIIDVFFKKRPLTEKNILLLFEKIDAQFPKSKSGTCLALFIAEKQNVFLCMVGDTELAAIYQKKLFTFPLHNFKNENEVKRYKKTSHGDKIRGYRYKGLNVSRVFGNCELRSGKNHPLDPVPSIQSFTLTEPMTIFMFTDGIREVLTDNMIATSTSDELLKLLEKSSFIDNATLLKFTHKDFKRDEIEILFEELKLCKN